MAPADKAAAEEEDARNKGPRMSVEMSFNNIVRKFSHIDYFPTHHILQSGRSNWPYLCCLWDLQVLYYYLFTCAAGHGNPTNGIFVIAPSSVSEYLYSANNNLPLPLINGDNEDNIMESSRSVIDCITT